MRRPKVKLECSNTNTKPDCPFGHITYQICKGAALLHCVSPRRAPDLRIRRGRCSSRLTPTRTIIGPTSLGKPVHNPPQNARKAGLSFPLPTCAFSTLRRRHFLQGPPWLSLPHPIPPPAHHPRLFTSRASAYHGVHRPRVVSFLNWARYHLWMRTGMALALGTGKNHAGVAGEVRHDGARIGRSSLELCSPQWRPNPECSTRTLAGATGNCRQGCRGAPYGTLHDS